MPLELLLSSIKWNVLPWPQHDLYVTGHAMTYASISGGRLPSSTAEYVQYGLLTEDEVRRLTPAENKQRDLLITW